MPLRYQNEVRIALPRAKVIELFDSTENMKHWQPGLLAFEPLSGTPGQEGATARLRYQMGKREIEMVETVTKRDLPDAFAGTYDAKGVFNVIENRFEESGPDETRWVSDNEFRFTGMMKLVGWLMPGAFKKQSQKYMDLFKAFAETGASVAGETA